MAAESGGALLGQSTIWQRQGSVLEPGLGADQAGIQECSVLYEIGPKLLSDTGSPVFKCWYTGGFSNPNIGICYAESRDGKAWIKHQTSGVTDWVLQGYCHSGLAKVGLTYYLFAVETVAHQRMDIYSSTDGITWTQAQHGAIACSGSGWKAGQLGNMMPLPQPDGSWKLLYEALGSAPYAFAIGVATAPTIGSTWTEYSGNPVLTRGSGTIGGMFCTATPINGNYWLWAHGTDGSGSNTLPCDIYRYSSPDLVTWTQTPSDRPVIARATATDGAASPSGQIADPWLVEANGKTYMFYESSTDGNSTLGSFRLKLAIADTPMAGLSAMPKEGAGSAEPAVLGRLGNPVRLAAQMAGGNIAANNTGTYIIAWSGTGLIGSNGSSLTSNGFSSDGTSWTVPRNGWYRVRSNLSITNASVAGITVYVFVTRNGYAALGSQARYITTSTANVHATCAAEYCDYLYAGETIGVRVSPSGGNVTIEADALASTIWIMEM